jgi:hydrogenase/urease accessory protein HupE
LFFGLCGISAPLAAEVVSQLLAGIAHPLYGADEIAWGE